MTLTSPVEMSSYELDATVLPLQVVSGRKVVPVSPPEKRFWPANPASVATLSMDEVSQIQAQIKKLHTIQHRNHLYIPIATILNTLSIAQARANANAQQCSDIAHFPTVVHFLNPGQRLFGDIHNTEIKSDIVITIRSYAYAQQYLEKLRGGGTIKLDDSRPCYSSLVAAGEIEKQNDGSFHLLNYLDAVKRYRPDLDRVYGLFSCMDGFSVWQLNPCQVIKRALKSEDKHGLVSWNNPSTISILQRFVLATYAKPILSDTLALRPGSTDVWRLSHGNERWNLVPCYAAHGPGRMTWVAPAFKDNAEGVQRIVKLYWADKESLHREVDLYARAHGQTPMLVQDLAQEGVTHSPTNPSWLGGLARVEPDPEGWFPARSIEGSVDRQLVGLLLASSGKPLNYLKSDVDILKCMYDLLQTLQQMNKNGVLHRDISYGNVFCYPEHYIAPGDKGDISGCIYEVLGAEHSRVWVLVTDLDQSTTTAVNEPLVGSLDAKEDPFGRKRRTGTPMFAAAAIADPRWKYPKAYERLIRDLSKHYQELATPKKISELAKSDLELYKKLLDDASAGINKYWVTETAQKQQNGAPEPPLHRPHHDAESVYWLMAFLLARAMPLHAGTDESMVDPQNAYHMFLTSMLGHYIGQSLSPRSAWGHLTDDIWSSTLHPALKHHAPLLDRMAWFLSVDWITICPDVPENFAYRILKLFLLEQIVCTTESVELDTQSPRPSIKNQEGDKPTVRQSATSPEVRSSSFNAMASSSSKSIRPKVHTGHSSGAGSNGLPSMEPARKRGKPLNSQAAAAVGDQESQLVELSKQELEEDARMVAKKTEEEVYRLERNGARQIQIERFIAERWYTFSGKSCGDLG